MKRSMKRRLVAIFASMLVITIGLICLANIVLLPSFYQSKKVRQMQGAYSRIVNICQGVDWENVEETKRDDVYDRLDALTSNTNVSIYIVQIRAYPGSGDIAELEYVYPGDTDRLQQVTKMQLSKYVKSIYFGVPLGDNCQMLNKTSNYAMYKVYDDGVESTFIELTGRIADDY